MFDTVIFDLDGTLTNPYQSFSRCLKFVFSQMGYEMVSDEQVLKWIGPPLGESLKNHLNLNEKEAQKALDYYRSYYRLNGLEGNTIYSGVKEMLIELKQMGKKIGLATAKLEEFAIKVLQMHDIYKYFDVVSGALADNSRIHKTDILAHAIKMLGGDINTMVMVGDRHHDTEGALNNKIKSIGVLWGYGSAIELEKSGASFLVKTPKELVEIVK